MKFNATKQNKLYLKLKPVCVDKNIKMSQKTDVSSVLDTSPIRCCGFVHSFCASVSPWDAFMLDKTRQNHQGHPEEPVYQGSCYAQGWGFKIKLIDTLQNKSVSLSCLGSGLGFTAGGVWVQSWNNILHGPGSEVLVWTFRHPDVCPDLGSFRTS